MRTRIGKSIRASALITAAAIVAAVLIPSSPASAAATTLWVDSVNGSDVNSGTSSTQAFKTLGRAQTAVQGMDSSMSEDIVVNLLGGTYSQTSPLSLTAADSGTNGHVVRWQAAPGASPTISGAQTVTGWTSAGNGVYKASVGSLDFRQLYVNGKRATRARFPEIGSWFQMTNSSAANKTVTVPAASVGSWVGSGAPEMVLETQWAEDYLRVKNITVSGASATVSFQDAESNILFQRPNPTLANGSPFHWEGNAAFLTQPGEWYLDHATSTVYYIPRPDEDIAHAAVTVPLAQTVLEVSGTSLDAPASNISFTGITFTGTTWTRPTTDGYLNAQGGQYSLSANMQNQQHIGRPPAAVHVSDATNIQFTGNRFVNVGSTALDFDHGTHSSSAIGNLIQGASGNGILMGKFADPTLEMGTLYNPPSSPAGEDAREVATGNTISDNLIAQIGQDYYGTAGINAGWVNSTTITHNEITDVPWSGISVGWGWQSAVGAAANNTVQYNEISNALNHLCDSGGIYHLSNDPGSTFSNNYIHEVQRSAGACTNAVTAMYFDQGSDGLTVSNNVLSDVDQMINQHSNGSNMTLSNNASSGKSVIQAAGLEPAYRALRASIDVAQGKPATASSTTSSSWVASNANDGNPATGWSARGTDTNAWWQVDLGSATPISQVQVLARQDVNQPATRTGFQVELSNDPTFATYVTVGRQTSTIPDAGSDSFNIATTAAFRYVRVQKTDGQYFFIADVRVIAAASAIGSAPADPGTTNGAYYTLTSQSSGLVADVDATNTADGVAVQQHAGTGGINQQWQITPVGGGLYQIVNRNSGKPMAVNGASMRHGAAIIQLTAGTGSEQLWYFQGGPSGSLVIRSFLSNQALEVSRGSTTAGAALDQWIPVNGSNELWNLTPAS